MHKLHGTESLFPHLEQKYANKRFYNTLILHSTAKKDHEYAVLISSSLEHFNIRHKRQQLSPLDLLEPVSFDRERVLIVAPASLATLPEQPAILVRLQRLAKQFKKLEERMLLVLHLSNEWWIYENGFMHKYGEFTEFLEGVLFALAK